MVYAKLLLSRPRGNFVLKKLEVCCCPRLESALELRFALLFFSLGLFCSLCLAFRFFACLTLPYLCYQ